MSTPIPPRPPEFDPRILYQGSAKDDVFDYNQLDRNSPDDDISLHSGEGDDIAFGGEGDDRMFLEQDDDIAFGSGGNDTIDGGDGDDFIDGGRGRNSLSGGTGDDTIVAGVNSTIHGGTGADIVYIDLDLGSRGLVNFVDYNPREGDEVRFLNEPYYDSLFELNGRLILRGAETQLVVLGPGFSSDWIFG